MIKSIRHLAVVLLICFGTWFSVAVCADIKPLPADQAFQFSAQVKDPQTLIFNWDIAQGYYLYKDRFHFKIINSANSRLSPPLFPAAIKKYNQNLGHYLVYMHKLSLPVPIRQAFDTTITVQVSYQGCSQQGFCYPPMLKNVALNLVSNYMSPTTGTDVVAPIQKSVGLPLATQQTNLFTRSLTQHNLFFIIVIFLGLGVLMSLTPCVLPMLPILSSILVGNHSKSAWHTFSLSLAYVLGMAIAYAGAGVVFALVGANIQPILQSSWVVIIFSLLFVVMGLSMLGLFQLQLPSVLRNRIAKVSEHQQHGSYFGVFCMGLLASLILSPCVTPPLVGVLAYISHQGSVIIGAIALFSLGFGIGVPLLIIGALGSRVLPKAGKWMSAINTLMGLLLFAVAIWLLARILPTNWGLTLWAAWIILCAVFMGAFKTVHGGFNLLRKLIAILIFMYGVVFFVGIAIDSENPWLLTKLTTTANTHFLKFHKVYSLTEIQTALQNPAYKNKPILLDFYADWCTACLQLKHVTFTNPLVIKQLKNTVLLQADVTKYNATAQKMLQHYDVIAPPTLLFFNKKHQLIASSTLVGDISAKELLIHLQQLPI